MKAFKILLAVFFPIACVLVLAPSVVGLISYANAVEEFSFSMLIETFKALFEDLSLAFEVYGFALVICIASVVLGFVLFCAWLTLGIYRKKVLGIVLPSVALLLLVLFNPVGVVINASVKIMKEALEESYTIYSIFVYCGLAAILFFIAAFIFHIFAMGKKEAPVEEEYEFDYSTPLPVLVEEVSPDRKPDFVENDVHIERGLNYFMEHSLTQEEVDQLLNSRPRHEVYEEEIHIAREEPVQVEEELPAFLKPGFTPREVHEDYPDIPFFHGVRRHEEEREEDLPFFHAEREEEPAVFEEVVVVEEAPRIVEENRQSDVKLSDKKPLHISRKDGGYIVKQVGHDKPLASFGSEEEAVVFAKRVSKVNGGVAIRLHDQDGKIRSI